jgi:hypothetical protein
MVKQLAIELAMSLSRLISLLNARCASNKLSLGNTKHLAAPHAPQRKRSGTDP